MMPSISISLVTGEAYEQTLGTNDAGVMSKMT
jgi:hypothetical protein